MSPVSYKGNNALVIRVLDLLLSLAGVVLFLPIILITMLLVILIDGHSPLFIQERLGKNKKPFKIFKIRTMVPETPDTPSHKANPSQITKLGLILRKYKLDELPQLINVIKGDMSIIGPRPSIDKENKAITLREKRGIYNFKPGITGLATVKKIDLSKPRYAVRLDEMTMKNLNPCFYLLLIALTLIGKGFHDPTHQ